MIYTSSTLRYRLLDHRIRLEPLRVLDARTIDWCGWRVTFSVLGASHAVSLAQGERQIVELLACELPDGAVRSWVDLAADRPAEVCTIAHDLLCHVRLVPFPLREGGALHGEFRAAEQLAVAFPVVGGGETPVTRIGWRAAGRRLSMETVHTYPEEGRGVRSESRFELREAR